MRVCSTACWGLERLILMTAISPMHSTDHHKRMLRSFLQIFAIDRYWVRFGGWVGGDAIVGIANNIQGGCDGDEKMGQTFRPK